jgi:hypothetical protein
MDESTYSGMMHRIERLEHDIRELAQCIVFMCEYIQDIHVNVEHMERG